MSQNQTVSANEDVKEAKSAVDLLDHFQLAAEASGKRTTHVSYTADPARGYQEKKIEEIWMRNNKLGEGSFGEVWREEK